MNTQSDDEFLQELIRRVPKGEMTPSVTISRGTIRLSGTENARLLRIAESRGTPAADMLEGLLK